MEYYPEPEFSSLIRSMSILRDRELLTSMNRTVFATQFSSLCIEIKDNAVADRPAFRLIKPQPKARKRARLVNGWIIRFRFNHVPPATLELSMAQVGHAKIEGFLHAITSARSPDQLHFALARLFREIWKQLPDRSPTDRARFPIEVRVRSDRTVRRRFKTAFGLPPKIYRSISRFHRILRDLSSSDIELVDLATKHEFSDQPHLSRDFRSKSGWPPGKFRHAWRSVPNVRFFQDRELGKTIRFAVLVF